MPIEWFEAEHEWIDSCLSPPYAIARPAQQTLPIVFCSPHSGRDYPAPFLAASRLNPMTLRKSEDAFVDLLFSSVTRYGAPLLMARFPRAYLDVNREPNELDARLIEGVLPHGTNAQSARVAGGLGVIPRLVADGEDIYPGRIPQSVAFLRIERLYRPFHAALSALLNETIRLFGFALLVDCHSMPSSSVSYQQSARPQFVLGDRFGTSCVLDVTKCCARALSAQGMEVNINRPYAGGFITEHYGRPQSGLHAIQIEINRALYMREQALQPNANFDATCDVLEGLMVALSSLCADWLATNKAAAE